MNRDAVGSAQPAQTKRSFILTELAGLSPAYFGMAMATGIVSLAAYLTGWNHIGIGLYWFNIAIFALLWALLLLRVAVHPRRVLSDLLDHLRAPGFFTTVAASCVLGAQALIIGGNLAAASTLWALALLLWLPLTFGIFTALIVKRRKPALDEGINGGWLLSVVATQAVAVLGALIAARLPQPQRLELNFFALSMWLWGGMLYIWTMSLIFYRYTFFQFSPADLSPPYWINMGAMAISTLAGCQLILNTPDAPYLESLLPFLKGFTIFYWATATWWIPMLVVLAVWRHGIMHFPLIYDPLYWGAVFPLGMYSTATHHLREAMDLPFLSNLPTLFFAIALLAWSATFLGCAADSLHRLRRLFNLPHGTRA